MRPMFNVVFSLIAMAGVAATAHAETKWNGGAGVRFLRRTLDDGLSTKDANGKDTSQTFNKRWEFRGSIGVSNTTEHVDFNFGMRTQANQTSEWLPANNATDYAFGLEQANVRLHGKEWMDGEYAVTIGRQKVAFLYDSIAQAFFDRNVRLDGFGWNWKKEAFGLNLSQYVLGAVNQGARGTSAYTKSEATDSVATTQSRFAVLYSFQPTFTAKISDEIQALFAVGYHVWTNTSGGANSFYVNTIHGGVATTAETAAANAGGTPVTVGVDNARQWQFLTDWNLPYNLRFVGEWIHNKKVFYGLAANPTSVAANRDAFALSLVYGVAKKAGDWTLMYSYSNKGIGSVVNTFTNGNVAADNVSHMFEGKYMFADSAGFGAKYQIHKEKAQLGGDGQPVPAPNNNRLEKQTRLELYTSVAF